MQPANMPMKKNGAMRRHTHASGAAGFFLNAGKRISPFFDNT
jgi:hypothetical protein